MHHTFQYNFSLECELNFINRGLVVFCAMSETIEGVGDLGACSFVSPYLVYDHLCGGFFSFGDPTV